VRELVFDGLVCGSVGFTIDEVVVDNGVSGLHATNGTLGSFDCSRASSSIARASRQRERCPPGGRYGAGAAEQRRPPIGRDSRPSPQLSRAVVLCATPEQRNNHNIRLPIAPLEPYEPLAAQHFQWLGWVGWWGRWALAGNAVDARGL
jgi:hypothetical protein